MHYAFTVCILVIYDSGLSAVGVCVMSGSNRGRQAVTVYNL